MSSLEYGNRRGFDMLKRNVEYCILFIALLALCGCTSPPQGWKATLTPSWRTIEVNEDLEYDDAWNSVTDLILKKGFDFEQLDKLNGYALTNWSYIWTGVKREDYRVKLTAKFVGTAKNKVEVKVTAEFGGTGDWTLGTDNALLENISSELSGRIGRSVQ